jgi:radical SAM superfamily enzyme YgiQ (UPF0313 family)
LRYEGDIYRPPSEAYSLLVQVTIGCSHNKCSFCSMYKNKVFRVRKQEEIFEDLEDARRIYKRVDRIFLCDGDALCLGNYRLVPILEKIGKLFPECKRVGVYARAKDILRKSDEEIKELVSLGLGICYIGAESGSDEILKDICKGENADDLIQAVQKAERNGMQSSVTFISGIGGRDKWEEHAVKTGQMISEMGASYVSLLTLMVEAGTPLYEDIRSGRFKLLTPEEVVEETYLMLKYANPKKKTVFRSNHASNYLSLRGDLPDDRNRMLDELEAAMKDKGLLKDERFRML